MRIAFVVGKFPSLSETFILNQITALIERGHEVEIYANRPPMMKSVHEDIKKYRLLERTHYRLRMPPNSLLRLLKGLGVFVTHFLKAPVVLLRCINVFKYGTYAASLKLLYGAVPLLHLNEYDIVHCHYGPNGLIVAYLKEIGVVHTPFITTFHGADANVVPRTQPKNFYEPLFRLGNVFTVSSDFMRGRVQSLGCAEDRIVKLPVGVDLSKISVTERLSRSKNEVSILTVGQLVEAKGIEYSIRAVAKILDKFPNIQYRIAGHGLLYEELQALVRELGVAAHVHLLGGQTQQQIRRLYEDADIFVLASVIGRDGAQEGQGLVLLEAQASGLPIISTKIGGIPEGVSDGRSGFLVPERDVDALAGKLSHLIDHPEVRAMMGHAGRKHVEENYDLEKLNEKLVSLYREMLEG